MIPAAALHAVVAQEAGRAVPAFAQPMVAAVRARFGPALVGVLFYGSCRRAVTAEGVLDLYAVVDRLAAVEPPCLALAARVLPPNVHYLEVEVPAGASGAATTLRCKCAIVTTTQLEWGVRGRLHPYFWARFAQPTTLAWARSAADRRRITAALAVAVERFLAAAGPAPAPAPGSAPPDPLVRWRQGLARTYATELRAEDARGRATDIVARDADWYRAAAVAAGAAQPRPATDHAAVWALRTGVGKALSLARLVKALLTFRGAVDYAAWKLARHAGRPVEVPDAVRARPWLHVWAFAWRLWRQGYFR